MKISRYMAFPLMTGFPSSIHYCKHTLCAAYKSYHNSSYKHYYEYEQKQKYFNGLTWASLGTGCLVLYWYYEKYKSLCASSQQGIANILIPLFSITNCQDINNTSSKHDCLDKNAEIKINKKNKNKIYKHCISAALRAAIRRSEERLLLHKEEYVRSNEGNGSKIEAFIRETEDSHGNSISLLRPFRIIVSKSSVYYDYPLKFTKRSVNNQYYESKPLIGYKEWHSSCSNDPCPGERDKSSSIIQYSKGFCCPLHSYEVLSGTRTDRRGIDYSLSGNRLNINIAYCPRYDKLWYNVYKVGKPQLRYKVQVEVQERTDPFFQTIKGNVIPNLLPPEWTTVAKASLSNVAGIAKLSRSISTIKAEILGDFQLYQNLPDLRSKIVLVPIFRHDNKKHEQVREGSKEWLIIDNSIYDYDSSSCNKIGSGFRAFSLMARRCFGTSGSCFKLSPKSLWEASKKRVNAGKLPMHFPSVYGKFMHSFTNNIKSEPKKINDIFLRYLLRQKHTTELKLEFEAFNISYIINIGHARIVSANADNFTTFSGGGIMRVVILNTGHLTSTFSLSLDDCSESILPVADRSFSLNPGSQHVEEFTLSVSIDANADYSCKAVLRNQNEDVQDMRNISFSTEKSCYCPVTCGCQCIRTDNSSQSNDSSIDHNCLTSDDNVFKFNETYQSMICLTCWVSIHFFNPLKIFIVLLSSVLSLGMIKMLIEQCLCNDKEGRKRELKESFLDTLNYDQTREKAYQDAFDLLLGYSCIFCFPILICIIPLIAIFMPKKKNSNPRYFSEKRIRHRNNYENQNCYVDSHDTKKYM